MRIRPTVDLGSAIDTKLNQPVVNCDEGALLDLQLNHLTLMPGLDLKLNEGRQVILRPELISLSPGIA